MIFTVTFADEATPFLKRIIAAHPKWQASALKSAGWRTSSEIKKGIKSEAPGGQAYEPLHLDNKKRRALEAIMGGNVKRTYRPMGRLRMAIGYQGKLAPTGTVPVGWLSRSAVYLGDKQQAGYSTEVTPKVRRMFAAAGIKIGRGKTKLTTPSRKTFKPMQTMLAKIAQQQFATKLLSYYQGNGTRSKAASKRTYKVYK